MLRLLLTSYVPSSRPPRPCLSCPSWAEDVLPQTELLLELKPTGTKGGSMKKKDEVRNCNKHVDKARKDQDPALDRYVL